MTPCPVVLVARGEGEDVVANAAAAAGVSACAGPDEITARGLIDAKSGEYDDAPFALYAIGR
jgi:hypothetical protein